METFVEQSKIDNLMVGSYELFSDTLSAKAGGLVGKPVRVFATFEDYAYGATDDSIVKIGWKDNGKGAVDIKVSKSDIGVVDEQNVDLYVRDKLGSIVGSMLGDECDIDETCNRLRDIAFISDDGHKYWMSDAEELANRVLESSSDWLDQYNSQYKAVRKSIHGEVAKTEGVVPSGRFGRLSRSRVSDFESDIGESLTKLMGIFDGIIEANSGEAFDGDAIKHGVHLECARSNLVRESEDLKSAISLAMRVRKSNQLGEMAKLHDNVADRARPMVVVSNFLSRMVSHG